jgi:hypothetical protein
MSGLTSGPANADLQFDRVSRPGAGVLTSGSSATCTACQKSIDDAYYDINGHTVCASCRVVVESAVETPAGIGPLLKAGLFGLGAAIAGAIVYYGVMALLNLEIGIVAILTGYMVGYAVKRGTGNRGGRRFQIMAVALTYLSIAMAYTPIAIKGAIDSDQKAKSAVVTGTDGGSAAAPGSPNSVGKTDEKVTAGGFVVAIALMLGLCAALPVIVIFTSMPGGLISAAIMFFGMQQAWKMTGAPSLVVNGPYRVGTATTPGV